MARTKLKWLKMRKKTEPEFPYEPPIWLGPISNGEFYRPQTQRERKMHEEVLRRADDFSRQLGMDRREFMASAMGMATTLSVLNMAAGCGNAEGYHPPNSSPDFMGPNPTAPGTSTAAAAAMNPGGVAGMPVSQLPPPLAGVGAGPTMGSSGSGSIAPPGAGGNLGPGMGSAGMAGDGGFVVEKDMCMNAEMAERLLKTDYFILDMQTHHSGATSALNINAPGCGMPGATENDYIRSIFMDSETTVAVLSGLPSDIGAGGDLQGFSNEQMMASKNKINKGFAPGADRMLVHCQTNPFDGPDRNGPMMEKFLKMGTRGWKCYPPVGDGSTGWFLTDPKAISFIQKAVELGEPLICAHKGFPLLPTWSRKHADPMPDVGVIAKMFPDVNFVIYHSACDSAHTEGPYQDNPNPMNGGADRLAKAVTDAGVRMKNVYAEMGSAWYGAMRDPVSATHYIGKMLKYVGEERLVWGSECCWMASPQCQIEAMKMFKMDSGLRDMYMYPDFTDALKRKMFGLTGAKLYKVDPNLCRYKIDRSKLAMRTQLLDEEIGPRRWALNNRPVIQTFRQYVDNWRNNLAQGKLV